MHKIPLNEIRTRSTVQAGIYKDYCHQAATVRFIDYTPGNGTRYSLVITSLSQEIGSALGCGDHGVMVVLANHRKVVFISSDGFLHWSYVKEKFDLGTPDAVAVAELLGEVLKRPHVTAEQFMEWQDEMETSDE